MIKMKRRQDLLHKKTILATMKHMYRKFRCRYMFIVRNSGSGPTFPLEQCAPAAHAVHGPPDEHVAATKFTTQMDHTSKLKKHF